MSVLVQFASRDSRGNTTFVGGKAPGNTVWQLSTAEIIPAIESQEWRFWTQSAADELALIQVYERAGKKYLVSTPDGVTTNNLDYLPPLKGPGGGIWPPSPLSIVGPLPNIRLLVNRLSYRDIGNKRTVTVEPPAKSFDESRAGWLWKVDLSKAGRRNPRSIQFDLQIPWPASYLMGAEYLEDSRTGYDVLGFPAAELTREKRDELDAKAVNYFSWDFGPSALDNGGPFRITEIRFVVTYRETFWAGTGFRIAVGYLSVNPVDVEILRNPQGAWTTIEINL